MFTAVRRWEPMTLSSRLLFETQPGNQTHAKTPEEGSRNERYQESYYQERLHVSLLVLPPFAL